MFPNRETYILQKIKRIEERFKVEFLDEAVEFLESLEQKAREKVLYNNYKARATQDTELLKKLSDDIWKLRKPFKSKKSILT